MKFSDRGFWENDWNGEWYKKWKFQIEDFDRMIEMRNDKTSDGGIRSMTKIKSSQRTCNVYD